MKKVKQRDDWEIHVLFKLFSFYICRISIKNCMVIFKNKSLEIIQRQKDRQIYIHQQRETFD